MGVWGKGHDQRYRKPLIVGHIEKPQRDGGLGEGA